MAGIFSYVSSTPVKLIKVAYIIGLSVIASMSIGAHIVVDKVVNQSEHSARTIHFAGQQSMLSQRTAYLLLMANRTGNSSTLFHLQNSIDKFKKIHNALIFGDPELNLPGEYSETVGKIYFNGFRPLDIEVKNHLVVLQDFHDRIKAGQAIEASELAPFLVKAQRTLLQQLNKVVTAHEADADEKVVNLLAIQRFSIIAILVALFAEAFIIFNPLVRLLQQHSDKLEHAASHDVLTGAPNRRAFYDIAESELSRCRRHNKKMSILMCDLDHFKKVNDTYGHKVGDDVLKLFAKLVPDVLRKEDIFARYGGEEFVILLPETSNADACIAAEKVCTAIRNNPIDVGEGKMLTVTTSIGLTEISENARNESIDDLLMRADEALYEAKLSGRDRVNTKLASFQFNLEPSKSSQRKTKLA